MAETKTKTPTTKKAVANDDLADEINFTDEDLEKRVTIHNISDWDLGLTLQNEVGERTLTRNSTLRLTRSELMAQLNIGNTALGGIDGKGSHATIYIEDAATRRWLGFETKDKPQAIYTDDVAHKLFAMTQAEFEKNLPIYIVTRAEKFALKDAIKRLGLNDYQKMRYAAKYIGCPIDSFYD